MFAHVSNFPSLMKTDEQLPHCMVTKFQDGIKHTQINVRYFHLLHFVLKIYIVTKTWLIVCLKSQTETFASSLRP